MKLSHYSSEIVTSLKPIAPACLPNGKPRGLWLSVDGEYDWKWWCEAEEFNLNKLKHKHEIILHEDHNILIIEDSSDLDLFTNRYHPYNYNDYLHLESIDWIRVSEKHDGIIIAPYQRDCRNAYMWYYGWDCASGCIWNTDVIKEIKLVERNYKPL